MSAVVALGLLSESSLDISVEAVPVVPPPKRSPDRILPVFIAASLIVHATIFLPSLLRRTEAPPKRPSEIPIELVQEPPKPVLKTKPISRPEVPAPKQQPKPPEPKKAEQPHKQAIKPAPQPKQPSATPVQSGAERLQKLLGPIPPGMDAKPLPGVSDTGTENISYAQLVLSQVAKAKKEGRYRSMPGAASVAFTVSDTGGLTTVSIVRPSGFAMIDNEAVAMVKRAAPFPPPPPGGRRDYVITLTLRPDF